MAMWLSKIYREIKVQHGKKLVYLWIDSNYSQQGQVKVSMVPYINDIIANFPEEINEASNTAAGDYLFEVRPSKHAKNLPDEEAISFHHYVIKLLLISNHARHDIQTTVEFMTTRV